MLLLLSMIFGAFPFCRGRKQNWAGEFGFGSAFTLAFLTGIGYITYLCGGGIYGKYLLYLPFVWGISDLCIRRHFWREKILALQKAPLEKSGYFLAGLAFFLLLFFLASEKELPCGWDPAFHALLSEKILRTGELSRNWLPFEDIPLNYPQGIHLVTAIYAGASGAAVSAALKIFMLAVSLSGTLLLAGLGERAFPGRKVGLYTAVGYLTLGGMATPINFWGWGGYPTAAGFLFFTALLFGIWHYPKSRLIFPALILFWGSLALTHLLALLLSLLAVGVWSLYLLWQLWKEGKNFRTIPECKLWKNLFSAGLGAIVLFSPCLLFQYQISGGVGAKSDAFYFTEEPLFTFWKILEDGAFIFQAGVLGVIVLLIRKWGKRKGSLEKFLLLWVAGAFGVFLFLGVPFRKWIALPLTGEEFSILVPSRFMSFACLGSAVFAGAFGEFLLGWCKKLPYRKYVENGLLLLLLLWGAASFFLTNTGNFSTEEALKRAEELKKLLPEDAYIVVDPARISYAHHLPGLLWRPCITNPIPASENRTPVREAIALFLDTPREKMDPALVRAFEEKRKCRVFYAVIPGEGEAAPVRIFPARLPKGEKRKKLQ